ncbi:uncharacterized protein BBA_06797 [Beauveria bassiana ARSEF 2860]|uniref:Uncharacterized protein n=1 Tax=Beauveria bassiana (strain ARSEF 2860) TaxID=655819 RepID=J4W1Q8_BEAB2|nr:uncharacterized protein BBA_06797 [Beauveria bassiana ARSEF 2860]EJP64415.1 hypothetical protein BBA_06797 [Beauveria bassiana ARSEF 2860]
MNAERLAPKLCFGAAPSRRALSNLRAAKTCSTASSRFHQYRQWTGLLVKLNVALV